MPPHVFPYGNQLSGGFEQRGGVQRSGSAKQRLGRPESLGKAAKDFGIEPKARVGLLDPLQSASFNGCFAAYPTTGVSEEMASDPHRIQRAGALELNIDNIPIRLCAVAISEVGNVFRRTDDSLAEKEACR
jgi:hypothetical protein